MIVVAWNWWKVTLLVVWLFVTLYGPWALLAWELDTSVREPQ